MKTKRVNTINQAFTALKEFDAAVLTAAPGRKILVLFSNEENMAKARRAVGGNDYGVEGGYPSISTTAPNLIKRLEKLDTAR